ncbi:hypothetical protein [Mesorhizobium sp.]|uniref:hypothetical protein n=1 Tax=Mesorhizobium sp. TaxID=1871066 RepID=UPI0025B8E9DD|nr:hypothetical protein [Mesorhizobium sp.]
MTTFSSSWRGLPRPALLGLFLFFCAGSSEARFDAEASPKKGAAWSSDAAMEEPS